MSRTLKDTPDGKLARWDRKWRRTWGFYPGERYILNRADRAHARMQTYRAAVEADYAPILRKNHPAALR